MKLFQLFESKELNSELLWFQRHISDNDLAIQMEIEDNKIVFWAEDKLIEWDLEDARQSRQIIQSAKFSYYYAKDVFKRRFELGEPAISKDAEFSYWYANFVIIGRFELGEPAISQRPGYSLWYARDVIKGRFELGEPAIAKDAQYSKDYQDFLKTLK